MTNEERREAVARLIKNAPDGYVFRGSYLVGKEDLIDFMVEHTDDIAHRYHVKGGDERGS